MCVFHREYCIFLGKLCDNLLMNDEIFVNANRNKGSASNALAGSGKSWLGRDHAIWVARADNNCCGIFAIEFEVIFAVEIKITVEDFLGSQSFIQVRNTVLNAKKILTNFFSKDTGAIFRFLDGFPSRSFRLLQLWCDYC